MATLDEVLAEVEDATGDAELVTRIREAAEAHAGNPDLVKNLRQQLNDAAAERDSLRRDKQVDVLKQAGVSDKAFDRFLRDWQSERKDDEFTVDNVKAAAADMGYALTAPADGGEGGETPPANDPAEADRRAAQERRRQLQTAGTAEAGIPPDQQQRVAAAEAAVKPGDKGTVQQSMAEKRRMLDKVATT